MEHNLLLVTETETLVTDLSFSIMETRDLLLSSLSNVVLVTGGLEVVEAEPLRAIEDIGFGKESFLSDMLP